MNRELSNITIVIPTFNRHSYAARVMQYWSGSEATVLVLDGSSSSIDQELLDKLSSNIRYHHLPELSFFERLIFAFDAIETDLVVLHGDDEFLLPSGLRECIRVLEEDAGLIACMGRSLSFGVNEGVLVGEPCYSDMINHQLDMEDSFARLGYHFGQYTCSTCYAVCRVAPWINALRVTCTQIYPVYGIGELQYEATMAFSGKGQVINQLVWLRSEENPSVDFFHTLRFQEFWTRGKYTQQKSQFLTDLAQAIADSNNGDRKLIRSALQDAFDRYLDFCKVSGKYIKYPRVKMFFRHSVPGLVKKIGSLINERRNRTTKDIRLTVTEMESEGMKVDREELDVIFNLIERFHEGNVKGLLSDSRKVIHE